MEFDDKSEHRTIIKFLAHFENTLKETSKMVNTVYGDNLFKYNVLNISTRVIKAINMMQNQGALQP